MKLTGSHVQAAVFLLFIFGLFLGGIILPDRAYSPVENRYLATKPELSAGAFFRGELGEKYDTYLTDQFPLRDSWVELKAAGEIGVLRRGENNGVYLVDGDTLVSQFEPGDPERLAENLRHIDDFARDAGVPVWFGLIPTSAAFCDRLPPGAPNPDQKELIRSLYGQLENVDTVDLYGALDAQGDRYIYYRTDHHWTSLGARAGAGAIAEALGLELRAPERGERVSDAFHGTVYAKSGIYWVAPDEIHRYVEEPPGLLVTRYDDGEPVESGLYHEEQLDGRDKYAYFLGGNCPLVTIETGGGGGALLLIRDSYADALAPFLLDHFSRIVLVDMRYYRQGLQPLMAEQGIDAVLVLYGLENLAAETNLIFLSM